MLLLVIVSIGCGRDAEDRRKQVEKRERAKAAAETARPIADAFFTMLEGRMRKTSGGLNAITEALEDFINDKNNEEGVIAYAQAYATDADKMRLIRFAEEGYDEALYGQPVTIDEEVFGYRKWIDTVNLIVILMGGRLVSGYQPATIDFHIFFCSLLCHQD